MKREITAGELDRAGEGRALTKRVDFTVLSIADGNDGDPPMRAPIQRFDFP